MESPDVYLLSQIKWQFFATLTLKDGRTPKRFLETRYFAWLRTIAGWHRVHFKKLLWVRREERGEKFGRLHLHSLIGGLPEYTVSERSGLAMKNQWKAMTGPRKLDRYQS
jgi:hypothetical protein